MNEDVFNGSIRKFLKTLGVSGQRETGTITLGGIGLSHEIKGEIELE
jgi:Family of unknown function (DUF6494)